MAAVSPEDAYRERWEYARHAEDIRYRLIQWYFVVAGAALAFVIGQLFQLQLPQELQRMVPLLFLVLVAYSVAICGLLLHQKAAYRTHVKQLKRLERECGPKTVSLEWPNNDAFPPAFFAVALVAAALAGATVATLSVWTDRFPVVSARFDAVVTVAVSCLGLWIWSRLVLDD